MEAQEPGLSDTIRKKTKKKATLLILHISISGQSQELKPLLPPAACTEEVRKNRTAALKHE
ncbi:hypothetical protein ACP70R_020287 [Stipagrostis hirtigluma subsp. patula]